MKYLKSAEEFNESIFGKVKDFLNKDKKTPKEKYEELVAKIMKAIKGVKNSNDAKLILTDLQELKDLNKLQDFLESKEGVNFKKMYAQAKAFFSKVNHLKTMKSRSKVEFNESVISKFKNFFNKDKEVEKTPEEKYKELVGLIIDFVYDKESEFHLSLNTFDVSKKELEKIGKWEEFKNSEEYNNDEFKNLLYKKLVEEITENSDNLRQLKDIFDNCVEELKEIKKWQEFINSDECKVFYEKCVEGITKNFDDDGAFYVYSSCITKIGKWSEFMNSDKGRKIQQMSPRKLKK